MALFLVPLTQAYHDQACTWIAASGRAEPPPPKESLVVVRDGGPLPELVATCYIYEAPPFSMAEFFVTNPAIDDPMLKHQAAEIVLEQWVSRCISKGIRHPMCFTENRSMAAGLQRYGMRPVPGWCMLGDVNAIPVTTERREARSSGFATTAQAEPPAKKRGKKVARGHER